jgi:hypothetical protein
MATIGTVSSVGFWLENCIGAELLRRRVPADPWHFLRYEDFAARPRASTERVLSFLGLPPDAPFIGADRVRLDTNHTLAGNPNRFRAGVVPIVEDDEWQTRLPLGDHLAITVATLPFLRRYGYRLRGGARPASG